jgi:hypothetical protein
MLRPHDERCGSKNKNKYNDSGNPETDGPSVFVHVL